MGKSLTDPLFVGLLALLLIQTVWYAASRNRSRLQRWAYLATTVVTLTLWALGTPLVESVLVERMNRHYPPPPVEALGELEVLVVLSGGWVEGPTPNFDQLAESTTARVLQGARTFLQSPASTLVMSGASDYGPPGRMVELMQALAVDMGVAPERVILEPHARTTFEHPLELLELGLVTADTKIGVVTSSWHLPRTMIEFEKHFAHVVGIPAYHYETHRATGLQRMMPRARSLARSTTLIHEHIGLLWYATRR